MNTFLSIKDDTGVQEITASSIEIKKEDNTPLIPPIIANTVASSSEKEDTEEDFIRIQRLCGVEENTYKRNCQNGPKIFICKWENCGKQYTKRTHLKNHTYVHSNYRPHKCDLCTQKFSRKDDLKRHISPF